MSKILEMYQKWSRLDKDNNFVAITKPGRYITGTENTANGQSVNFLSTKGSLLGGDYIKGFIPHRKKHESDYPLTNDVVLEKARIRETQGTHVVTRLTQDQTYSFLFKRE
jgi:hypothetical protein